MQQRTVIAVEHISGRRGLLVGLVPALMVALLAPPAATAPNEGSEPAGGASAPAAVREQAQDDGLVRVLVELDVPATPEGALSPERAASQRHGIDRAQQAVLDAVERRERRVTARLQRIPFLGLRVTPAGLELLEQAPRVADITLDELHQPVRSGTVPHVGGDQAHADGFDGEDHTVAVIDTGVDRDHPTFSNTDVQEACFVQTATGTGCPNGEEGAGAAQPTSDHGTHVAGIAVGSATDETYDGRSDGDGVAPAADLLAIRVFPDSGGALQSDIVRAMEHVAGQAEQGEPVAAVNLSLGTGTLYSGACDDQAYEDAAAMLASHDVATVAATGNSGSQSQIIKPACVPGIFSAGATAVPPDHPEPGVPPESEIASYANRGPDLVDLVAPGNVVAPVPGGGLDFLQGTSMAAPHVAGAFAVLQQAGQGTRSPAAVREDLREAAEGVPEERGAPDAACYDELRVARAVDLASESVTVTGAVTDGEVPIGCANVTVDEAGTTDSAATAEITTSSQGTFALDLAPATYTVSADAPGYEQGHKEVTVSGSGDRNVEVALTPATRLAVTVTDSSGQAIQGASADVESGDGAPPELEGSTDANGAVSWSDDQGDPVPTGEVTVTASADGYQDASQTTEVAPDEANGVGLSLEAEGGLLQPILDLLDLGGLGLGL